MANENSGLDSFLTPEDNNQNTENKEQNAGVGINLEDEFAKLLNDFVNQGSPKPTETSSSSDSSLDNLMTSQNQPASTEGVDGFVTETSSTSTGGLDNYVSSSTTEPTGGLDGFVTQETTEQSAGGLDDLVSAPTPSTSGSLDELVTPEDDSQAGINGGLDGFVTPEAEPAAEERGLKEEEYELAQKIKNFQDSMTVISMKKNLKLPQTDYVPDMLIPNYKPSIGKKIAEYLLACWDIINKYAPEDMKRLAPDADDEGYLSFAETLNDTDLQLAIISYVEILIDIEICEVSYEQKKELMIKNRIKRELYEEYMELQERKKLFIAKLKEKNFPIDVDRLINNYFRAAQKDADGSFEALVKNPAMFSPIQMEKIKPKFFGLIKVTPEDGVKANQKIGAFVKKLKV
jgi:hypothetical protein